MTKLIQLFFIVLFFATSSSSLASGANAGYSFKHYNTDNGLSQNTVRTIMQDNMGFMWFGTKDGLNRFDGTTFKLFKFSPDGELSDNVFHRIIQDKNNNIWVSTENGVYIYDVVKEVFHVFDKKTADNLTVNGVVTDMVIDDSGDIWMSVESKGIFYYNIEKDYLKFYSIPIVEDGLKMVSLYPSKDKGVWVFRYSSIILHIDKINEDISEFNLEDDPELLLKTGEVLDIYSDHNNVLLIATSQKGLFAINTVNKTHNVILDKDGNGEPIFVRSIERVDPNTLWIGTESGIYILKSNSREITNLRHNPAIPNSISDNAIYSIYKDRDGGVWVGSYFGGVDYYSNVNSNFELFYPVLNEKSLKGKRVREFSNAPDGNIWIGTEDGGLNLFDPRNSTFLPIPQTLSSLYPNIHTLFQDGDLLWISTYSKGLNKYNTVTGELVTYIKSDDPHSISHNSTFAMCKDRQGYLWIGTLSGVNIYDKEKDQFFRIEELKGMSIQDIFEDSNGYIWISTFLDGVYRFDPSNNEWKIFLHDSSIDGSLPYNKPTSIFEDSKRRLWVTTQGGGFGQFHYETETFTTYNTSNGLNNDVVYQIQEDVEGKLWLSTNQGLVRFDPEKEFFVSYTVDNGLKSNQFNYKSSFKDSRDNIYFGSLDGFIRFNPAELLSSNIKSETLFTELFVNNRRISPSVNNSILKQSIIYTDEIQLPHNQNSVSFGYANLDYSGLNKSNIYYKLEGFDEDWIKSTAGQPLIYSNLKPGKYKLHLGTSGYDSNEQITVNKTLSIIIMPPYWLTGWAYFIYSLTLLGGLFLLYRYLHNRVRLKRIKEMRDFERMKERELYRSKINFFTNVAHEIRTPLTLIKAPLDHVLMKEAISDNIKDNLQIMQKNTDRLLDLTNQLLDFRKTESDSYLLSLKAHNVTELIKESQLRFTPFAKQKGIEFEFILPDSDMFAQIDKDAFLKIVSNLLNNGIKYCESYVRVKAFINNDTDQFNLITENDGELIPQEYEEEIFKPFVQFGANEDVNGSGTGIGLALASSLAQLHNGVLSLDNDSVTNRFHLTLPIGDISILDKQAEIVESNEFFVSNIESELNTKKTILLVDDDIELLQFESKLLLEYYNVLIAENGIEALEVLKKSNVNLIVSDIMMPEMDGFEFMEKVKSDIEYSHIPVILLTAKVNNQSKVQGYELGADAYLDKPFSVDVLLARIENLLQSREKLRESFLSNPFTGVSTIALTKSDEEFIKKLNVLIQENIAESDFNVENMAEHFNMSRASFYRKVKGVLDLTPNEYLRVERLKKAAYLLREEDYKVNEVCYMVGFNSPSYFTKCFQQQFGILPKEFQEQR
ncbi:MAG: hybrid sensor histidine kinase/response regulator [Fermentimonas caenicola]|jgi:ligand-binding sensor domain-containing protein/signal transduction histidine kinase/DNA-binding response OmpR family regulator|nr:MAG: hybrid sensor histidine kinase/response regulator [Fermentimonas caenicola]